MTGAEHIETVDQSPRLLRWWPDGVVALALALLVLVAVIGTINHYGLTYDEGWYISKSILAREWTGLLLRDPGAALSDTGIRKHWFAKREFRGATMEEQQPGAAKLAGGLVGYPLGLLAGVLFPERAGTAVFLAGCTVAIYAFLAGIWGRTTATFAALALLLMPRVFAHAHLCALDVPVMSMMFISVALMFAAVKRGSLLLACLSGLAWGIALSCKINAVFVPLILGAWILLLHRRFAWRAAACLIGGGVIGFFLTWPWLWHDTGTRLIEYFAFHLRHYPVAVSYFGRVSGSQPWHYPSVMTAITSPPLTLALVLGGIALAVLALRRGTEEQAPIMAWRRSQAVLILIGAVLTIGPNSLPGAPKYTGVRLFLPFFPFASVLAALAFRQLALRIAAVAARAGGTFAFRRRVRVVLAVLALVPALTAVGESHPYQLSYYNLLIGGLPGAVERGMEATYWGDSYVAACYFVTSNMAPGDGVWVDLPGCEWIIRQYILPVVPSARIHSGAWPRREASWAIVQNKASEMSPASRALIASGPPVYAAELNGVPLSLLYDRDGIRRALERRPVIPSRQGGSDMDEEGEAR